MKKDLYKVTDFEIGVPTSYSTPKPSFYEALGHDGMIALMYNFYDKIYESKISHFFPQDEKEFEKIKHKNSLFFIQMCGGPKVYDENLNTMDMNQLMIDIHKDFSIYKHSRLEWLGCMKEALEESSLNDEQITDFWSYVESFSKLTVNAEAEETKFMKNL